MSRGKILIVDDNEMNRELLEQELDDEGFDVVSAEDGPEALEILRHETIDLVLLDIQMPQMSGLEVLERVRRDDGLDQLPIIMATARAASADVVEALELGATDYVTKPIDFPVLLARINTHLRVKQASANRSTGGYQKLKGDESTRFREAAHYCAVCLTANVGEPASCADCDADRPADGWPTIPSDEYPELGRVHGGYFFDKMLGAGWGGVVYRARSVDLDRAFAAKVARMAKEASLEPDAMRDLVVAEVEALAKLRNPHIVEIFEVVHFRGDIYALITEFLEGTTLRQLVDQGPLRPSDAMAICRQTAIGLEEVHRHGMVHCDLKPENIMVQQLSSGEYFAKLLDFGIVKSSGAIAPSGVFIGTPKYAAPESFNADVEIDRRADVYSLGVLFYRLMTSAPPYRGNTFEDLLRQHLLSQIPRLEESGATHPDFALFDTFVQRAMAKLPDDRQQSMTEVIHALDDLARQATALETPADFLELEVMAIDATVIDGTD